MAILNPPAYMETGEYTARDDRLLINTLVPTAGVVEGFNVEQLTTPSMKVRVSAGTAFVKYTASATQGTYHIVNDGYVELNVTAAHTTLTRIDRIVLTVRDASLGGGLFSDAIIQILAGTPASSPDAPSVPANSISLGVVTVSPKVTSIVSSKINIAPARVKTIARLSYSLAPQAIETLSTARPTQGVVDGMMIFETDTGIARYRVGTQWKYFSGDINAAALGQVIQANGGGWNVTAADASIRGGTLQVTMNFSRTGSAITVPSNVNIGNTGVATLQPAYRPYFTAGATSLGSGRMTSGYVTSAGSVVLANVAPGSNISTGETLSLGFVAAMGNTLYSV